MIFYIGSQDKGNKSKNKQMEPRSLCTTKEIINRIKEKIFGNIFNISKNNK
jgi:hypothetical protein